MNEQSLQGDIELAEELDKHLQEQSVRIEDIQGSLEAIAQAIMADEEQVQLSDHQQTLVDKFHDGAKIHKGKEIISADASALEGFVETTAKLARKAVISFSEDIPLQFKLSAKALNHYVGVAQKLRERLLQLRQKLAKRDFPYEDIFEYGAYSRFFQIGGNAIGGFTAFQEAMDVQSVATRHVALAGGAYSVVIMEKLLANLQELQAPRKLDAEKLIEMRDSIDRHWLQTWKEAEITLKPGQTPQAALNAFPDRKFVCLAPLLDNRYLVAHKPKSDGGNDPAKITTAIRHYGASLVFDKNASVEKQPSMNVPNIDDLLTLVDQTINVLHDMRAFEDMAKKNDSFAKDFKKAADILNKRIGSETSPEFFGFITEYFKLATAVGQSIQQPYVQMAWMYIRCAMVVTALAELAAIEEPKQRIVTARFLTKQNTEFVNPALESFNLTSRVLRAAKRASMV